VRLWIDECLSPTLVGVAQRRYEATCNEYRGLLHAKDPVLYAMVSQEEWVFVTNNELDFRALTAHEGCRIGPRFILLGSRVDRRLH
jgi:predicted nuclease of predicted toxin-antitoxin system